MFRLLFVFIFSITFLLPNKILATTSGTVPTAAVTISEQLDAQLLRRIGNNFYNKSSISIVVTPAVLLDDLSKSSPLARQLAEEITKCLVQDGYSVTEIRKASKIIIDKTGPKILTQDSSQLATTQVEAVAILTGTYTVTKKNVRFNIKLLHIPTNDILATASTTIPITKEIYPLLVDKNTKPGTPSVTTKLQ